MAEVGEGALRALTGAQDHVLPVGVGEVVRGPRPVVEGDPAEHRAVRGVEDHPLLLHPGPVVVGPVQRQDVSPDEPAVRAHRAGGLRLALGAEVGAGVPVRMVAPTTVPVLPADAPVGLQGQHRTLARERARCW